VHLTDGEVMASAVEQPDLFVTIFDGHGKAVHAFLSRRAGRQTADDVQREVWLQAFRSRHRFDAS
jgi:DNA-directed RNA polymerase specialized sigma24 family protein